MFRIVPKIQYYDTFAQFSQDFHLEKGDVLITNRWLYDPYIRPLALEIPVIFQEEYGKGEPTDEMIDAIGVELSRHNCRRLIAFGGGTIIDICKILSLFLPDRSEKLFTGEAEIKKARTLIAIPTTCGTGSEMTNVAIAELKSLKVKKGLAAEETFADLAILTPEPLQGVPDYVFATSSIDALIHAVESYLSPQATPYTQMYSLSAIQRIVEGFQTISKRGKNIADNRKDLLKDFCLAANFAGIAFGNAGCAAVHAMSYSIGSAFHIPHGEANYQFFTEVLKLYRKKKPEGKIQEIDHILCRLLNCSEEDVYSELEKLLDQLIPRKALRTYGMMEKQIKEFASSTIKNQQRLLKNNYVDLSETEIQQIFSRLL